MSDALRNVTITKLLKLAESNESLGTRRARQILSRRMVVRAAAQVMGMQVRTYKDPNPQRDAIEATMVAVYQRDGIPEPVKALAYAYFSKTGTLDYLTEFKLDTNHVKEATSGS